MDYRVIKATTEADRAKAFAIREEVFVIEQGVPASDEFDEHERSSCHFVALDANDRPIGSARWRQTENGVKLERFTVKKTWRKKGVGTSLVRAVLDDIKQHVSEPTYVYLHAQVQAMPLYEKSGFQKQGDSFYECEILHYKMSKVL